MTDPTAVPLWHGYSLTDIDKLSRLVIAIDRWSKAMDTTDRYEAVRFGITEHLITAKTPLTRQDLINLGRSAANRHVAAEMKYRGYDLRQPALGQGSMARFQRYWQTTGHTPWDERLVEHLALAQVWPRLPLAQQQALTALAITDDHQAAADSLRLPLPTYAARLRKARRSVLALWHEHETPRPQRRDKRVLSRSGMYRGRRLLTEQDLEALRERRAQGATLRALAEETGYSAGGLCNLLNGKKRPAA
ncbi:hypothetical protein AB0K09_15695 [Streptomyces sp. NPDC049577]|uniref:hypothetical protein n=1 Tax=Streptomyces sp. NPDC049577 TaxID=3155153 RepID=UPI003435D139